MPGSVRVVNAATHEDRTPELHTLRLKSIKIRAIEEDKEEQEERRGDAREIEEMQQ